MCDEEEVRETAIVSDEVGRDDEGAIVSAIISDEVGREATRVHNDGVRDDEGAVGTHGIGMRRWRMKQSAAARMAQLLHEPVGHTVGYIVASSTRSRRSYDPSSSWSWSPPFILCSTMFSSWRRLLLLHHTSERSAFVVQDPCYRPRSNWNRLPSSARCVGPGTRNIRDRGTQNNTSSCFVVLCCCGRPRRRHGGGGDRRGRRGVVASSSTCCYLIFYLQDPCYRPWDGHTILRVQSTHLK